MLWDGLVNRLFVREECSAPPAYNVSQLILLAAQVCAEVPLGNQTGRMCDEINATRLGLMSDCTHYAQATFVIRAREADWGGCCDALSFDPDGAPRLHCRSGPEGMWLFALPAVLLLAMLLAVARKFCRNRWATSFTPFRMLKMEGGETGDERVLTREDSLSDADLAVILLEHSEQRAREARAAMVASQWLWWS